MSQDAPLVRVLADEAALLEAWLAAQLSAPTARPDRISEPELRHESAEFLSLFHSAVAGGAGDNRSDAGWRATQAFVAELSRSRASRGYSPAETANFVFSLKQPLFERLQQELEADPAAIGRELWRMTLIVDELGLYTMDVFQRSREDVIRRQQQELLELSTPVIKLWDGILAVPLIGTLDSARTQVVMESLLQRIVETGSTVAIIDITGVPTVDTLVAQHLLKTVAAARLMGADCIVSGIRPQIAQTIVQLGVVLGDVATKATMADAVTLALRKRGLNIVRPNGN